MNIVDYDSLKAAVADWLNRSDLTARIPDFIGLAEVWMMRKLRTRLMEAEDPLTLASGARTIALPSAYREPLNLWWNNGVDRDALRYVPPGLMDVWTNAGRPMHWAIDAGNLAFERPADQAYSLTFRYRTKVSLSTDAPTNALLTAHPDIYLYATLVEAAPYLKDTAMMQIWLDRRGHIEHDIREAEERQNAMVTLSTEAGLLHRRGRQGFNVYRGY